MWAGKYTLPALIPTGCEEAESKKECCQHARLVSTPPGEIGIVLPNNQRQHRTLNIQKDVQPYALRRLLCPVSAAHAPREAV